MSRKRGPFKRPTVCWAARPGMDLALLRRHAPRLDQFWSRDFPNVEAWPILYGTTRQGRFRKQPPDARRHINEQGRGLLSHSSGFLLCATTEELGAARRQAGGSRKIICKSTRRLPNHDAMVVVRSCGDQT